MPNSIPLREIIKFLEINGFILISQTGSHAKYRKKGEPTLNTIVPIHGKDIAYGTFRSILRQARLTKGDFDKSKK